MTPQTLSQTPLSREIFDRYQGKWIAVLNGDVIADADSLEELRNDPDADGADAYYHVPPPTTLYY